MTSDPAPLTGPALAYALFEAGLAPDGTIPVAHQDGPTYWSAIGGQWCPWRSWDAVAHLILRFRLEVHWCTPGLADHVAQVWPQKGTDIEIAWDETDIVAAHGRLALRLHAQQQGATP